MRRTVVVLGFASVLFGCRSKTEHPEVKPPLGPPELGVTDIEAVVSKRVADRRGWAEAIAEALRANELRADANTVCSVVAVVAQESGFQADPVVPELSKLVEERIEQYRSKLGQLGKPVFRRLLAGHAPTDPRTFSQRLAQVRTEHDVDLTFRDLLSFYQASYPKTWKALSLAGKVFDMTTFADLNPITTAGSMQVSVRFAERWARSHKGDPATVREALYTRSGGLYYGTARLFGYKVQYTEALHRFADYNAGVYASRNAAIQAQVARLTGGKLALDGDVLAYDKDGDVDDDQQTQTVKEIAIFRDRYVATTLPERRMEKDVLLEKTAAFEDTDTYQAIKKAYAAKFGGAARYAIMPDVEIDSPKLRSKRSTAWFARSVQRRFDACLATVRSNAR